MNYKGRSVEFVLLFYNLYHIQDQILLLTRVLIVALVRALVALVQAYVALVQALVALVGPGSVLAGAV